jgi:hypothetical protein
VGIRAAGTKCRDAHVYKRNSKRIGHANPYADTNGNANANAHSDSDAEPIHDARRRVSYRDFNGGYPVRLLAASRRFWRDNCNRPGIGR